MSMEFCVFDVVVNNCFDEGKVPLLKLAPKEYQRLECAVPDKDAPTVGLLLGRSTDSFSIGRNYVGALAKTGVNIRFLTYRGCEEQLSSCDGLLLPGGAFDSPEAYYTDPKNDVEFPVSTILATSHSYIQRLCASTGTASTSPRPASYITPSLGPSEA